MDDVARRKPPRRRSDGLSFGQTALAVDDLSARLENRRTSSPMNRPVHAPSAHERRVGRIDDGVGLLARDVTRARYQQGAVGKRNAQNYRVRIHGDVGYAGRLRLSKPPATTLSVGQRLDPGKLLAFKKLQ